MADVDLVGAAARGDRESQARLAFLAIESADDLARPIEALVAGEVWGRIAASHGLAEDARGLGAILLLRATYERSHGLPTTAAPIEAEAMTWLNLAAGEGDELAARLLVQMADSIPREGFDLLRQLSEPTV